MGQLELAARGCDCRAGPPFAKAPSLPDASRFILHVGASKCGSTSLQTALCRRPEFTARDGRRFAYVAIDRYGALLSGPALLRRAETSFLVSTASPNATSAKAVDSLLAPAIPALEAMIAEGTTPILSCEGWGRNAEAFAESGFVTRLGGGAQVALFVRPPVDWMNSAWWQWGAWTPLTLDKYIDRQLPQLRWPQLAKGWSAVPGVARVDLGLATSDIAPRFFDLIGADTPPMVQANAGVPPAFLLFMMRNRKYRPDPHSPQTEFVVARHLPPGRHPTPWVLGDAQVARIMAALGKVPAKLRKRLPPADQAEMDGDPRWTQAEAYADRRVDDLTAYETPEALADVIGQLRGGLGEDAAAARADALARLSGHRDVIRAADTVIAASVDEMYDRLKKRTGAKDAVRA